MRKNNKYKKLILSNKIFKIFFINSINNISKDLCIKQNFLFKICKEKKIKIYKDNIFYKDIVIILDHLKIKYEFEDSCFMEEKLQELSNKKEVINNNIFTIGIVGHINHGKTTLIENLISKKVVEKNNITQNLNIYKKDDLFILDTPGHEIFGFIRNHIIKSIDKLFLIISLEGGVAKETEKIINLIISENLIEKLVVVYTKQDIAKHKIEELNKLILEKYGLEVINYFSTFLNDKNVCEKILKYSTEKDKLSGFDGFVLNVENIEEQQNILLKLNKGEINKRSFLIFDYAVARIMKIKSINLKPVSSINSSDYAYVTLDQKKDFLGKDFFVTENETFAHMYEKMIYCKNQITDNYIVCSISETNFLFLVSDEITKKAIKDILVKYKIENVSRIITGINLISASSIDKNSKIIAFNYCFDEKIKKEIEKNNKINYFESIYDVINYLNENIEDILLNTKISSVFKILKIFEIKNTFIAGGKVLKGEFSMNEKISITTHQQNDSYLVKDAFETNIISIKKKNTFAKKIKINDEAGIIVNNFKNFKVGMYIIKFN